MICSVFTFFSDFINLTVSEIFKKCAFQLKGMIVNIF